MRYLVISPCEDVRSGKEFERGQEFLPEPDPKQADRLIAANCIEPIPDSAPPLPGTGATDAKIAALEDANRQLEKANGELRGKVTKTATEAGAQVSALNRQVEQIASERDAARLELATAKARVAELEKPPVTTDDKEQGSAAAGKAAAKGKEAA